MPALMTALRVGDIVDLRVGWGNQRRMRCPVCIRFTGTGPRIWCSCGAVYGQPRPDQPYRVEALP